MNCFVTPRNTEESKGEFGCLCNSLLAMLCPGKDLYILSERNHSFGFIMLLVPLDNQDICRHESFSLSCSSSMD